MDFSSTTRRAVFAAARQRGYSLLEMSLAVGAIAIIAMIAFLAFTDTQQSANQTRALNEINAVASSARQFSFVVCARWSLYQLDEREGSGRQRLFHWWDVAEREQRRQRVWAVCDDRDDHRWRGCDRRVYHSYAGRLHRIDGIVYGQSRHNRHHRDG